MSSAVSPAKSLRAGSTLRSNGLERSTIGNGSDYSCGNTFVVMHEEYNMTEDQKLREDHKMKKDERQFLKHGEVLRVPMEMMDDLQRGVAASLLDAFGQPAGG